MSEDHDRGEWLSCPECGSDRVDVEKHSGYDASIKYNCRNCPAKDGYWL